MTDYLVDDGGDGTDPDKSTGSWATAYATLTAAYAGLVAAGDTIYMKDDTVDDGAARTITSPGLEYNRVIVISVDVSYNYSKSSTTQIGVTNGDLTIRGYTEWWGVKFYVHDDFRQPTGDDDKNEFNDCTISLFGTSVPVISIADTTAWGVPTIYKDTTIDFNNQASAADVFELATYMFAVLDNVTFANMPATISLFDAPIVRCAKITVKNTDLSSIDDYLVHGNCGGDVLFKRCKLNASVTAMSGVITLRGSIKLHSCDTGDGYWYFSEYYITGYIVQATNCYLNATYDGSNGFSAKMVSNTVVGEYGNPLRFKLSEFDAAANPTLTVETITAGVTLQNDEFWIEVESPDVTDEALGNIVATRPTSITTAPANLTTSTAAWTEDLTSEVKQKIEETISGGAAGIHTVWACLAKPSTTVYVDPDVTVS